MSNGSVVSVAAKGKKASQKKSFKKDSEAKVSAVPAKVTAAKASKVQESKVVVPLPVQPPVVAQKPATMDIGMFKYILS